MLWTTTSGSVITTLGSPIMLAVVGLGNFAVGQTVVVEFGGPNQESVVIRAIDPAVPSFTAVYTKTHAIAVTVKGTVLMPATPPTCAGSDPSGSNTLHTSGWTASQSAALMPGDFLSLVPVSVATAAPLLVGDVVYLQLPAGVPSWAVDGANVYVSGQRSQTEDRLGLQRPMESGLIHGFNLGRRHRLHEPASALGKRDCGHGAQLGADALSKALSVRKSSPTQYRRKRECNARHLSKPSGSAREDEAAIALINPQGTFRLAENRREAPCSNYKLFSFKMKCREAI